MAMNDRRVSRSSTGTAKGFDLIHFHSINVDPK